MAALEIGGGSCAYVLPFPIGCSEIARRIVEFVRAKNLPYSDANTKWKTATYEILGNIGRELGFKVFHEPCPGLSPDGSEFLLDLIWDSNTGGVELAAECEFESDSEVFYDFRKLVYVKAPFKVLIYAAARTKDSGKGIRSEIESYMAQYTRHVAGEQYLFVEFGAGSDHRCY
jgi:hypothetical protein